ncbi:Crp/Fnr family transcriptional regulator [Roseateles sp. DAIF2]|uniref:Crp/Fnr family transcriptional regulator n=1 Tax=Roseateles sp. DAIF2 TaxID=2714952 RepID=UPI0018A2A663|nr:Crp/Fnr family transcriptional regulator [Roseateles sp. DAIF2]QPF74002.1 Crp/Fnr family transcriptional regulator [Roseateles sp. DAIF2]
MSTVSQALIEASMREAEELPLLLEQAFAPAQPGAEALRLLASLGVVRLRPARALLLNDGDGASALWLLSRGVVSIGHHDAQGLWRPSRSVHAGDWIDNESAWIGGRYLQTALAETEICAYEFPLAGVEAVLHVHPQLARALLASVTQRARRVAGDAHDLLAKSVLARCAGWLIEELRSQAPTSAIVLRQQKRAIAAQLGTSPETFSRTLRQLREMHVIEMNRNLINVRDAQALRRLNAGQLMS